MQKPVEQTSNEIQLDSVLYTMVEGVIIIDEQGRIVKTNPAVEKTFGYSNVELIGSRVNMLMPEPYASEHDQYMQNYLTTGKAKIIGVGRETWGLKKNGETFPLDLAIGEMLIAGKRMFTGIVRNISERKQMENSIKEYARKLEISNKDLDDFAYTVSHDLKEPLRGICNFSQFLLEDFGDKLDADGAHKLQTLVTLSRRMESLINDILFYSRLERIDMPTEPVDLEQALTSVLDSLTPLLSEKNVKIHRPDSLPILICNRMRVGQVFQNLITNAVKYNDTDDIRIEIGWKTWPTDAQPTLSPGQTRKPASLFYIKDNGIGIPEKHLDTVFKIFKRLHQRNKYGGGTGAGLAIVKAIVEKHGGTIWAESKPGEGATFFFTLQGERENEN
jgi:PAS domain S-box-containing protein